MKRLPPILTYIEWQLLRYLAQLGYEHEAKPKPSTFWDKGVEPEQYIDLDCYDAGRFTRHVLTAAKRLSARGLIAKQRREYERGKVEAYFLTDDGRKWARVPPPRKSYAVPLPPLDLTNDNIAEVLGNLSERWEDTMTLGGSNGTHHSASLLKLVRHGLAQTKQRKASEELYGFLCGPDDLAPSIFGKSKGSRVYRLSDAGKVAQADLRARRQAAYDAKHKARNDAPKG